MFQLYYKQWPLGMKRVWFGRKKARMLIQKRILSLKKKEISKVIIQLNYLKFPIIILLTLLYFIILREIRQKKLYFSTHPQLPPFKLPLPNNEHKKKVFSIPKLIQLFGSSILTLIFSLFMKDPTKLLWQ